MVDSCHFSLLYQKKEIETLQKSIDVSFQDFIRKKFATYVPPPISSFVEKVNKKKENK